MSAFSPFAWRGFINSAVLPGLRPADGDMDWRVRCGIERIERLRDALDLDPVWLRLVAGLLPHHDPFEALREIVLTIAFPPDHADPPTKAQIDDVATALRKLKAAYVRHPSIGPHVAALIHASPRPHGWRLPTSPTAVQMLIDALEQVDPKATINRLMPASQPGATGQRNWLALYMRERVMPFFCVTTDCDDIALLITAANPDWPAFTGRNVEQLQAW